MAAKSLTDRHGSSLDELTLAEFIASGGYDRHVRRSRLRYRHRRDRLISALAQVRPGPRVTGLAAGLHAVLHLPPGRGEADVVAAADARGLALDGNARLPAGRGRAPRGAGAGLRDPAGARIHHRGHPPVRSPGGANPFIR